MANKTVIQGINSNVDSTTYDGADSRFYNRPTQMGSSKAGTIVEGMGMGYTPTQGSQKTQPLGNTFRPQPAPGRPIVGFLYSVSRTPAGEYWPLYLGQNTIGKGDNCQIILREATISSEHAVLQVRQMKNPEKVIASICDARSTNGTMLNGMSLAFSSEECHNGDVLTVGNNYELVVILIDAATLGLHVSEGFISIDDEEPEIPFNGSSAGNYTRHNDDEPPIFNQENNGYTGTVGMDGNVPGSGGTVGM